MADDEVELVENKKAKSDLWDHFLLKRNKKSNTIQQGQAVCRHCNAEVKHANGTDEFGDPYGPTSFGN